MQAAELTSDSRNALSGGSFAFPRLRKMPLSDAGHVRNALARFNQVKGATPEEKAAAKAKIKAAAKKFGIEVSADFSEWAKFAEPLLVAGPGMEVSGYRRDHTEFGEVVRLPFVRAGSWDFANSYGPVDITDSDLDRIVSNFEKDARRQDLPLLSDGGGGNQVASTPMVPLNEEHAELPADGDPADYVGPGAVGWVKKLERSGDTVYADIELNRVGEQLIRDDRYRAVSPELFLDWTDPETGESWGKTATGLALTTMPRMKGLAHRDGPMAALAASEGRVLAFAELADVHIDSVIPNLTVAYCYPQIERLPIHTSEAVKGAKARFMTVEASEGERDEAWGRLKEAAQKHGVDVPATWRALKASECAALLMQEADGMDDDSDEGLLPPCQYQPPFGMCPGYTRSDPDNDGDADCCAMAAKGCNGYIPMIPRASGASGGASDWANPLSVQPAPYGYSEPHKKGLGGPMQPDDKETTKTGQAAPEGGAQTVAASEPSADPKPPETPKAAEPQPEPVPAGAPADFAELRNLYAAEKVEREKLAARVQASEAEAKTAHEQVRRMEQATEMAKVSDRLDGLVKTGRITPAEKQVYSENIAKFAEDDWMLKGLEQRPENSAVDLRERGKAGDDAGQLSESARLDLAAKAHMSERKQAGDPVTYKTALLHVAKVGYQG